LTHQVYPQTFSQQKQENRLIWKKSCKTTNVLW